MQNRSNKKIQHLIRVPDTPVSYPETIIYGAKPGKTVTISAGVHSREYVGIEAVNRLAAELKPQQICGKLRLIHAINYSGFILRSPDVCPEDGKNLNRSFPGDSGGTSTQRLAAFLEQEVIADSDAIIDLHSGGFCESLIPHVYYQGAAAEQVNRISQKIAMHTSVPYLVRSFAKNGLYSHAGQCGVPAIILERGCSGLWSEEEVLQDIEDAKNILRYLEILNDGITPTERTPLLLSGGYYEDAPESGCWYPAKRVGDRVRRGEPLGKICGVFGDELFVYRAKEDGVLLYQTASLGIEKGTPMIAYGIFGNR